ncbi:MAG: hypothetical protein J6W92_05075 [Paludibacteraceae bacterium]|nr:hypothetical protein [Paludibacteraceae bacterium]
MEKINSMEEQEALRIVEHLDMQKLPESLQQMISLASTPEEQDIILMVSIKKSVDACDAIVAIDIIGAKYHKASIASIASQKIFCLLGRMPSDIPSTTGHLPVIYLPTTRQS